MEKDALAVFNNTADTMQESWTCTVRTAEKQTISCNKIFLSLMAKKLGVTRPSPSVMVAIDEESLAPERSNTRAMVAKKLAASIHAPYMTIVAPVFKRGNSSTIARSPKRRRKDPAIEAATTVLKNEGVLDATKTAESSRLSPEAVAA